MEIIGFTACAFIGLSLGLIGAGGSILTVPVLVFLFRLPPLQATSYSLFVVGLTSLFSVVGKARLGEVLWRTTLMFGIVSVTVVLMIRHFLIPIIPNKLFQIHGLMISYNWLSMFAFAVLMILAAGAMIFKKAGCLVVYQTNQDLGLSHG